MPARLATQEELSAIDREIQSLIKAEDNHKDKGMLLLMQAINRNLTENTYATLRAADGIAQVDTKVQTHIEQFKSWRDKGMGAYKMAMIFGAAIQAILVAATSGLGWAVFSHLRENDADHLLISNASTILTSHSQRIDYNDRRLDDLYSKLLEIQRFEDAREQNRTKK